MATESFTSSGTTNWVCPIGVTKVQVELWGGGGNGWGGDGESAAGGGGAYSKGNAVSVTPGKIYQIVVGAATADSTFGGTLVVAKGGNTPASRTAAGVGGAAASCVGDVKYSGGNGGVGYTGATGTSAAGGGAAGPHGNGNPGETYSDSSGSAAKTGGSGDAGSGGAGGVSNHNPGADNVNGGGGGAGGWNNDYGGNGGKPGGAGGGGELYAGTGAVGQAILTYTYGWNTGSNLLRLL